MAGKSYYIASCLFTARFPQLSMRVQEYAASRGLEVVRCCVPRFRVRQNTERIPDDEVREAWAALPTHAELQPGDTAYTICANCTNITLEQHPGVAVRSLWKLVAEDPALSLPSLSGMEATVQDCWRTREQAEEQAAVRTLLGKMGVVWHEAPRNHAEADFCGATLFRAQPKKNAHFAPKHYVEQAEGLFQPHDEPEIEALMREHAASLPTHTVITACHYCLEGLLMGGADAHHIAKLVFSAN